MTPLPPTEREKEEGVKIFQKLNHVNGWGYRKKAVRPYERQFESLHFAHVFSFCFFWPVNLSINHHNKINWTQIYTRLFC